MNLAFMTAFLIICVPVLGAELLYQKRAPGVIDSAVLVTENEFSQQSLERIARKFLDSRESLPVKKLTLFVDREAELGFRFGKAMSHPNYYNAQLRRENLQSQPTIAEVLSFPGSAVLRGHMPDGSIWSRVLSGSNPLDLRVPGVNAEILYLHIGEWGFDRGALIINVYVRLAGKLSLSKAEEIARELWRRIPFSSVVVHVRNDEWFIESEGYPWENPFLPLAPLPPYSEFSKTIGYYCSKEGTKGCMEFGLMYPAPPKERDAPIRRR